MQTEKVVVLCNNFEMACRIAIITGITSSPSTSELLPDLSLFIFINCVSNTEKIGFRYSQNIYSFAQSFDLFA